MRQTLTGVQRRFATAPTMSTARGHTTVSEHTPTRPTRAPATSSRRSQVGRRSRLGWFARVVIGSAVVAMFIVGGTAFRVWMVARHDNRQPADMVIVLGAAQYGGDPSPIFSARLRHARALYEAGLAPRIVTTGGAGEGDTYTEAEAGRRYLVARGVAPEDVIAVGEGSDTLGSLRAVAERARAEGWRTGLIVSDPWHSLRARTMARDNGLVAWTSPTRSGPVVRTRETQARYIARETAALLYYRLTHSSAEKNLGTGLG